MDIQNARADMMKPIAQTVITSGAAGPSVTLNPADPFEHALIAIVETNRRKRRYYALDGDPFSNFTATAQWAGFKHRWMSPLFNCAQKLARISSLTANERVDEPANEAVGDTLLDNAVYGVIAYADWAWTDALK